MLKTSRTVPSLLNSTAITRYTALAVAGLIASSGSAFAMNDNTLPVGGNVASGSADFQYHADQPQLDINQHSDRVIIDWSQFNIGANATTQFNQNSANAIAVNRVHDVNPSQILGNLRADGKVIVLNSNGVFFGSGANIDVSGLLVSTGELDAQLFQNSGQVQLSNINSNPNAKIENHGQITIKNSGLAAFVAPHIANSGVIEARLGKIALASGADKATVDMYGDGLVELALDDNATKAVINNSGTLKADGGKIALTASAAKDVVDSVINMDGVIEANSVGVKNGVITLGATNADIQVTGKINAKGGNGKIDVTSDQNIRVADTAEFNANADIDGNGGTINLIADKHMDFRGAVFARGGSQSGNGGFAEISGYEVLGYTGYANLGATNGQGGSLLLDPAFAVIHSGILDQPLGLGYVLSAQALANTMQTNTTVTVQADNFIDVGTPQGGYNTGIPAVDAILNGILGGGAIDLSTYDYNQWETRPVNIFGFIVNVPTLVNYNGTTQGSLKLESNTVNFNRDLTLGNGDLDIAANTVNLNALLSDVDGLLAQSDITTTANIVNVLSNTALIQQGIYVGDVGSTVNVAAGTYDESVDIEKAITLNGANAGIDGNGVRGAETIIRATDDYGVYIGAHNVKLDGFTVDGTNNADDADYMILAYNANNARITNNIVTGGNFGVFLYGTGATNSKIDYNKIHNIHGLNGQAIHIHDNAYADILNNTISDVDVGITTESFNKANPTGDASTISKNIISAGKIGIRNNLSNGASQTGFIISANTITAENPADARRWTGIDVISQNAGVATLFQNNDIDGSGAGARQSAGYEFTNMNNANRAVVDGGSVKNVGVGIWATDGSFYTGAMNDVLIKNVAFSDISETGILVEDTEGAYQNAGDVNPVGAKITIGSGNTFTNTVYDLIIAGDNVTIALDAGFDGVDSTFVKVAGPARYSASGLTTNNASINTGIGATAAGGNVYVDNGTFTENVVLNKGLTLRSLNGRVNTMIQGIAGVGALGTVVITDNVNNATLGLINHGFNIIGFDNGNPGIENAAVYLQGAHDSTLIQGNRIIAKGDLALVTENYTNSNLTIDRNIFSGKTYTGAAPDVGDQFTVPNVSRNLIYVNPGASDLVFTNNSIKGNSGLKNVVTLHADGGLADGNVFTATSDGATSLSINGNDWIITDNSFTAQNNTQTSLELNDVVNATVTKNTIVGGKIGITLNSVVDVLVGGSVADANIIKDIASNWGNKGINVYRGSDIEISYNDLDNIGGQGIYAENYWNSPVTLLTIANNSITGTTFDAISVNHWNGAQILDNDIDGSVAGSGISLGLSKNSTIDGNTVKNVRDSGVYLSYNNHDNVISNNIISNARYGVHVDTSVGQENTDTSMIGNTISDVTTGILATSAGGLNRYDNNTISASDTGIQIDGGNEHTLVKNTITGGKIGIALNNVAKALVGGSVADGNTIKDIAADWNHKGISVYRGSDIEISYNSLDNIGGQGIYAENYWNSPVTPLTIANNTITDTRFNSISVNHWNGGAEILNNDIDGSAAGNGIQLSLSKNTLISGNTITNVHAAGVHLRYNNHDTMIADNTISFANNGIHVGIESNQPNTNTSMVGNTISDVTTGILATSAGGLNRYDNNTISASDTGIQIDGGNEHTLVKNIITGGKIGIALNNVVKALVGGSSTDGNTIKDTLLGWHNAGIRVYKGLDIEISHNKLRNIGGQGIYAENYWASPVTPLTISDNVIRDAEHNGIQIAHWNGAQILDNRINGTTHGHGVQLSLTSNSVVSGNMIKNVYSAGVHLNYNNHFTNIEDNTISNAQIGVHVATTGGQHNTYTEIADNTIFDVTTGILADHGSNLTIRDNILYDIANEGIRTNRINTVVVEKNELNNVGSTGIRINRGRDATVVGNELNDIGGNGVQVSGTSVAEILRNTIRNIQLSGIVANGVRNSGVIGGNTIVDAGNHGIKGNNNASMRVRNNTIRRVGQNGIHLTNSANTVIARNTVNGAVKGIYITANTSKPSIRLRDNVVRNASKLGVHVGGSNHSFVTLRDNRFNSTLDGALFESGKINLKGTNIFKFKNDGLVFDGANVSLAKKTFGTTVLTDTDNTDNTNSYFIRLANGALFAKGNPTILDATQVTFSDDVFTNFVPGGFILPFLTYTALENRLYDFDDDNTLGQIFFTFPGGADINDVLPQQMLGRIGDGIAGSLTILNAPISRNTVPNFNNLANIETAAGGDNTSGDASLLNDIETVAGQGEQASCWNQVFASTASSVTYSLDTSPASMLDAQASCGG